jgi:hypothetical protein
MIGCLLVLGGEELASEHDGSVCFLNGGYDLVDFRDLKGSQTCSDRGNQQILTMPFIDV